LIIVGSVEALRRGNHRSGSSNEIDNNDYYPERLQAAYKAYGHCVIFTSMTKTVNNSEIARRCVEFSTIQSLLPALYVELSVKPLSCIEKIYESFLDTPEWDRLQALTSRFVERKATEFSFCQFLDVFLAPLICKARRQCPSEEERHFTDGILATYYSIQQFLNNGMETEFHCKKTDIKINPVLYEFGTKFDAETKYLSKGLECKKPEPTTTTTKTTTTTTTTKLPITTKGSIEDSDQSDDERSFGKFITSLEADMSAAEEKEEEPPTTTEKPAQSGPVRVRLARERRQPIA